MNDNFPSFWRRIMRNGGREFSYCRGYVCSGLSCTLFVFLFVCLFGNSMLIFPWGAVPLHFWIFNKDGLLPTGELGPDSWNNQILFSKMLVLSDLRKETAWNFFPTTVTPGRQSSLFPVPWSLKLSSPLRGLSFFNLHSISTNWFCCYQPEIISVACDQKTYIQWLKFKNLIIF